MFRATAQTTEIQPNPAPWVLAAGGLGAGRFRHGCVSSVAEPRHTIGAGTSTGCPLDLRLRDGSANLPVEHRGSGKEMTNMPGSGNGGYGAGWTPPTPGQQPGTEGPRNAYGHPLAQPPHAPAGGYPPRQPGTNAYGHPLAPQQAQVPPTVPPQPGTNAYGGPLAAPQPVASPPGYGPPPGTNGYGQPPAPAKNRKPLLIAFAIAVVVAIVGAAGWTFLNTGSSSGPDSAASAGDAVKGYLEALSRGDANGALAFSSDQPASKDFLTDDILKQQIAKWPITNIRILSDSSSSGGNSAISFGQVHVAVNFGDKSSDTTLTAKKDGDHWKMERAAIKVEATSSGLGNQVSLLNLRGNSSFEMAQVGKIANSMRGHL